MKWIKALAGQWTAQSQTKPVGPERLLTDGERHALQDKLFEFSYWLFESVTGKRNRYMTGTPQEMFNYPDKTLIALSDHTLTEDMDLASARRCEQFISSITHPEATISGSTINEYLAFLPVIEPVKTPHDAFQMLLGLHECSSLPMMDDYSDADDQTKQAIMALITVTQMLYKLNSDANVHAYDYISQGTSTADQKRFWNEFKFIPLTTKGAIRISDDDLINLIIEHPDKAEAIAAVIIEDKINDASLVRDRVFSSAQPLRAGIL